MPNTTYEMWVHGQSLHVQDPDVGKAVPYGWGMDVKGTFKKSMWVQFAIPTPVIAAGQQLRVSSAMVKFKTEDARVVNIHVWDGDVKIASHDDLNLDGGMQVKKVPVGALHLQNGVGISVKVGFWDPLSQQEIDQILKAAGQGAKYVKQQTLKQWKEWGIGLKGFVRFAAAGCEFQTAGVLEVQPLPRGPIMIDPDKTKLTG